MLLLAVLIAIFVVVVAAAAAWAVDVAGGRQATLRIRTALNNILHLHA